MAVTMKDIAKKMGLSESTISLALNDKAIVSEKTKRRVKAVADEMGYVPNTIAQNLANKRNNTFGLIVPDIESAYYGQVVKAVDESVRKAGYSFVLAISNEDQNVEESIINSFISQKVEGILIAPVNKHKVRTSHFDILDKRNIPFVFITAYYEMEDALYVMSNIEEGTYKMTHYLLDLGHRDILFMCGDIQNVSSADRLKGYQKAYEAKGMTAQSENVVQCDEINYDGAKLVLERLLEKDFPYSAIITMNDEMALAVINTLKSKGIDVPQDVSVGGYDNTIFSKVSAVSITTVNQGITEQCEKAVGMLIRRLGDQDVLESEVKLNPELIVRDSTSLKRD